MKKHQARTKPNQKAKQKARKGRSPLRANRGKSRPLNNAPAYPPEIMKMIKEVQEKASRQQELPPEVEALLDKQSISTEEVITTSEQ
jgi:hypothetical protein